MSDFESKNDKPNAEDYQRALDEIALAIGIWDVFPIYICSLPIKKDKEDYDF